jgi:probable F420-dependent oxidoreductase
VDHAVIPTRYEHLYPETADGRFPFDVDHPLADPLIWLTWVGAITQRIKLGTAVLVLPQRQAVVTAKAAASLDRLTGGRLILGVGAGWLREEFEALQRDFATRGKRLSENILTMRALWTGEPATFHGADDDFEEVICSPTPAGRSIPVHIGGFTVPAAVRAGRIGDGFFPGGYEDKERLAYLVKRARQEADDAGRDPDALEITTRWTKHPEELQDTGVLRWLEDIGVHRVSVPVTLFDRGDLVESLASFGDRYIAAFAS